MKDVTGAACVEFGTEMFFDAHPFHQKTAKTICNGDAKTPTCPLLNECRAWGIANLEWGVWGGLSEKDRERLTGKKPSLTPLHSPVRLANRQQPEAKESHGVLT
jgi:hypothetical protein